MRGGCPFEKAYEREQVYEEAREASAAARAAAAAAEQRRPKPLDKGGGMWPVERVVDFGAGLVHRVKMMVPRGALGGMTVKG